MGIYTAYLEGYPSCLGLIELKTKTSLFQKIMLLFIKECTLKKKIPVNKKHIFTASVSFKILFGKYFITNRHDYATLGWRIDESEHLD